MTPEAAAYLAQCPMGITSGAPQWAQVLELERLGLVRLRRFGVRAWVVERVVVSDIGIPITEQYQ